MGNSNIKTSHSPKMYAKLSLLLLVLSACVVSAETDRQMRKLQVPTPNNWDRDIPSGSSNEDNSSESNIRNNDYEPNLDPREEFDELIDDITRGLTDIKTQATEFLRHLLDEFKKSNSDCVMDIGYYHQTFLDAIKDDQGLQDFMKKISVPFWNCETSGNSLRNRKLQAPTPKDTLDSVLEEWIAFVEDSMVKGKECGDNWMEYGQKVADIYEDGWNDNTGLYTLLTAQITELNKTWRSCL